MPRFAPTPLFATVLAFSLAADAFLASPQVSAQDAAQTSSQERSMERTVTVTASAVVSATPDEATIQTGVSGEAGTAREVLSKNSAAMAKVIAKLKSAGVEAKDIQTTQFNVKPVYVYPKEGRSK